MFTVIDNPAPASKRIRDDILSYLKLAYIVKFRHGGYATIKDIWVHSDTELYLVFEGDSSAIYFMDGRYSKHTLHPADIKQIIAPKLKAID